jgi:hypothetical protein
MKDSTRIMLSANSKDKRESLNASYEEKLMGLSVATAEQHLKTAKLTHEKITKQIDMRTTTLAGIAGNIFADMMAHGKAHDHLIDMSVLAAFDILAAVEAKASKETELQKALEEPTQQEK